MSHIILIICSHGVPYKNWNHLTTKSHELNSLRICFESDTSCTFPSTGVFIKSNIFFVINKNKTDMYIRHLIAYFRVSGSFRWVLLILLVTYLFYHSNIDVVAHWLPFLLQNFGKIRKIALQTAFFSTPWSFTCRLSSFHDVRWRCCIGAKFKFK